MDTKNCRVLFNDLFLSPKLSASNKKYNFDGKVAIVTDSSSGIGAAIAIQFAQLGAKLTITGRDAENLEKVAQKIEKISNRVKPLQLIGDLRDDGLFRKKLIDETLAKFGRLDVLVNNAAAATPNGTLKSANLLEEFDQVYKLNVRVPIELIWPQPAPHLEKTQGNVVNISSAVAYLPYYLVYSSSKAALDMVTKTAAFELDPKGIRVNSLSFGLVETNFGGSVGLSKEAMDKMYADRREEALMKRIGLPEDISSPVSFLASDDARNITGLVYLSDSGALICPPQLRTKKD